MSLKTLKRVALVGGVMALGGAGYFTYKIQNNFRNAVYTQKAIFLFENYPAANDLIGKPFRYKNIDLGDTKKNFVFEHRAQLEIPVNGSKGDGKMFLFAHREKLNQDWELEKLDMEVKGTRWTFWMNPEKPDIQKTTTENPDTKSVKKSA
ncbi:DgyrCDS11211 [Dimorphilus gyrociliatus]|uniref:DgyrCDS11211 n=1 Tax=Dimorphilus gyrociliatus TaxID=2664684 RepID=A0A7I8W4I8_9ANNE|nr:DgyrCDS11211 [Dimorphilus gyrociliatus]